MSDQFLWKDIEQFQELSDQESETVSGSINYSISYSNSIDISYLNVGACPACRSGFDPILINDYGGIIKKLNQDKLF